MKLGVVCFLSLITAGCGVLEQQSTDTTVQESYFVPVIRSDVSSSGYTPSVTPVIQQQTTTPRIYTPVLR